MLVDAWPGCGPLVGLACRRSLRTALIKKIIVFGSAIFYPAMPENKEENKIKQPLSHPYDVRFGP